MQLSLFLVKSTRLYSDVTLIIFFDVNSRFIFFRTQIATNQLKSSIQKELQDKNLYLNLYYLLSQYLDSIWSQWRNSDNNVPDNHTNSLVSN